VAQHHALASALVGGYHFAFVIGAACVSAGILIALAVLRGRPAAPALEQAPALERAPFSEEQAEELLTA
jgi:hypothetical protein